MRLWALALLPTASAARWTTTWALDQAQGEGGAQQWAFVPAGSVQVLSEWLDPVLVSWTFAGSASAADGSASLGLAGCFAQVAPNASETQLAAGPCQLEVPRAPSYAVGAWLYGDSAVAGGRWSITAEYGLAAAPPSPPAPPAPPAPLSPADAPGLAAVGAWSPSAGSGCSSVGGALSCSAGVVVTSRNPYASPQDALAQAPLALGSDTAWVVAVFLLQAQTFSRLGFPAPLELLGSSGVVWASNLPNTPGGESCLAAGDDCPAAGGLAMAERPTAAVARVPAGAGLRALQLGFAPLSSSSWGAAGGNGCASMGAPFPCYAYGPVVSLAARDVNVAWAPDAPKPAAGDLHAPASWTATWPNVSLGFAAGSGDALALMASGCGSATAVATLGWTAGGVATVAWDESWDVDDAAPFSLTSTLQSALGGPVLASGSRVPEGPLILSMQLAGGSCASRSWGRVLATNVRVGIGYDAAPAQGFMVQSALGACLGVSEF